MKLTIERLSSGIAPQPVSKAVTVRSTVQAGEKLLTLKQAYELAKARGCDAVSKKAFYNRGKRNPAKVETDFGLRRLGNSSSDPTVPSFEDVW
jgi:hypothetical protein